jgi:hypothetical protein
MKNVKPRLFFIGNGEAYEKFLSLETSRNRTIEAAAKEWLKIAVANEWITKPEEKEFWNRAIPQQLFDTLESMQGGEEAAVGYVEHFTGLTRAGMTLVELLEQGKEHPAYEIILAKLRGIG